MLENFQKETRLNQLTLIIIGLFSFLLPFFELGNTWMLILLVILCLFISFKNQLWKASKRDLFFVFIPSLLLLVEIVGVFYAQEKADALEDVIRGLSFLFLPLCFFVLAKTQTKNIQKIVFTGITIGCVTAALLCWSSILYVIWKNNEAITQLFTWKRSNEYLTQIIDIHPPYLGALVLTSMFYLFKEYIHVKKSNTTFVGAVSLIMIFSIFLFHLVVRNSLLYFVMVAFGYILFFKKWKTLLLGIVGIGILTFAIIENGNHYLKRKYYKMLDFSDEKLGDKRFQRLDASYQVFLDHPIIGAGLGYVDDERLVQYKKMKDKRAIQMNFNSHNQYLEYLSTFGLMGFLAFAFVCCWLLYQAFKTEEYFLVILLALCMFACVTESFLERELGIKFFSLVAALIIFQKCKQEQVRKKLT